MMLVEAAVLESTNAEALPGVLGTVRLLGGGNRSTRFCGFGSAAQSATTTYQSWQGLETRISQLMVYL